MEKAEVMSFGKSTEVRKFPKGYLELIKIGLPSGHDAWVVGNEPAVVVDFQGMIDYAKAP